MTVATGEDRRSTPLSAVYQGLPAPTAPLVGRREEINAVVEAVATAPGRLVTVTGPGGIGKTRVALEAADRLDATLPARVALVALAGVTDPHDVPTAIAAVLGVAHSSSDAPLPALISALGQRDVVLVLDNLEHLPDAVSTLEALLNACPGVRLLVTTQRPLNLADEHVFALAPLPVPDAMPANPSPADITDLAAVESVALFVERATFTDTHFRLTAGNADAMVAVCRELGGSPLAIELAAARLRIVSLAQLAERLRADPLGLLATSSSASAERHRSLRATIDWTIGLLDPDDRDVLDQLSVFEHDFSLVAAEAVVAGETPLLDTLDRLLAASLLRTLSGRGEVPPRLSMPVPVRDVARQRLQAAGRYAEVHQRLVDHVVALADRAALELETEREQHWLDLLELDIGQLREILAHLRTTDPAVGLRVASALGPFWLHRGFLGEGRRHLALALVPAVGARVEPSLLAAARSWEARLAADQGIVADRPGADEMLTQLEEGLAVARCDDDVTAELRCLDFLSHVLILHDADPARGLAITFEGVERARQEGRPWWLAQLLQRAAVYQRLLGDLERAGDLAREALAVSRQLDADRLVVHAGQTVAHLPPELAGTDRPSFEELFDLATKVGDQRMRVDMVMSLGVEALVGGQFPDAAGYFRDSITIARDTGYWYAVGYSIMCTSAFAAAVGDHVTCARQHGACQAELPLLRRGMPPAYYDIYVDLVAGSRTALSAETFDRMGQEQAALGWEFASDAAARFLDVHAARSSDEQPTAPGGTITKREAEVLSCIAAGATNKDVARLLHISPSTVMHHTMSIYRKLGASGRAEAVAIAQRRSLLPEPADPRSPTRRSEG